MAPPKLILLAFTALASTTVATVEVVQALPPPVVFENRGQIILALISLVGTVLLMWNGSRRDKLAMRREERQRQWLVEDRKAADEKADHLADRIRSELAREADTIAKEAWQRTDVITAKQKDIADKIDENTAISRTAAENASNADAKIALLVKPYNSMVDEDRRRG